MSVSGGTNGVSFDSSLEYIVSSKMRGNCYIDQRMVGKCILKY